MCSCLLTIILCLFFTHTAPPQLYTLSLHDALPILTPAHVPTPARRAQRTSRVRVPAGAGFQPRRGGIPSAPSTACRRRARLDRKSTRLNSSHLGISYAVFCLKKKKQQQTDEIHIQ